MNTVAEFFKIFTIISILRINHTHADIDCFVCLYGRLTNPARISNEGISKNSTIAHQSPRIGVDDSCRMGMVPKDEYLKACPGNKCVRLRIDTVFDGVADGHIIIRGCIQEDLSKCSERNLTDFYDVALGETKRAIGEVLKNVNTQYSVRSTCCCSDKCNHSTTNHSSLGFTAIVFMMFWVLTEFGLNF